MKTDGRIDEINTILNDIKRVVEMIDTKALREAADRATKGSWHCEYGEHWSGNPEEPPTWNGYVYVMVDAENDMYSNYCVASVGCSGSGENDAAFIALANPQTILQLLDVVKAAREAEQHDYITPELANALAELDGDQP